MRRFLAADSSHSAEQLWAGGGIRFAEGDLIYGGRSFVAESTLGLSTSRADLKHGIEVNSSNRIVDKSISLTPD